MNQHFYETTPGVTEQCGKSEMHSVMKSITMDGMPGDSPAKIQGIPPQNQKVMLINLFLIGK